MVRAVLRHSLRQAIEMSDQPSVASPPDHASDKAGGQGDCCWYRASYPFALLSFALFAQGNFLVGIALATIAFANRRSEDWYRHRWPWILMLPLALISLIGYLALLLANANPDQVVPY
jgi:hypothetical protein